MAEALPRGGELRPCRRAGEEGAAQLLLQLLDLLGNGGLGHIEPLGRPGHAAAGGHLQHIEGLGGGHKITSSYLYKQFLYPYYKEVFYTFQELL